LNKAQKYLWELRIFTITVLQDRNYSLWERLIILGMFCQKLQENVANAAVDTIPDLIATYTAILEDGSLKESLSAIPVQYSIQMELLKEIADKRYFMGVANKRYLECFGEFLNGIQYTANTKVEQIGERYEEAYRAFYEPFMKEHEYIMENYLVNYVFRNVFPFSGEKSLFDSYMMLVIHYSLIKMHLIGMSAIHKGLREELVIKLVQSFAKTVEHSPVYLNSIAELMRQNGYNTMAYMAILIKN
jgi:lysine-N-methylase